MVRSPSPSSPVTTGADNASAGWVKPLSSPGTRPWVAKARILKPERFIVFTALSFASFPRKSTFEGSSCSASAIDFNSSAVSGSRGKRPISALSTPSSFGLLRRFKGAPRVTLLPASAV